MSNREQAGLTRLNPGSPEAVESGCTCPVIDNHHGKGVPSGDMLHRNFWIAETCHLHGRAALANGDGE